MIITGIRALTNKNHDLLTGVGEPPVRYYAKVKFIKNTKTFEASSTDAREQKRTTTIIKNW